MNIAITGPHSQGKSTLCSDLIIRPEFRKFTVLGNITRGIKDRGIEINEGGSDFSQSLVISKHIEHFFFKNNVILDRCMLDGMVYTEVLYRYNKQISEPVYYYARHVFEQLVLKLGYDVMFYIDPTLPIVTDNVRSTKLDFFNQVKEVFEQYIKEYNINVIHISGDRDHRVESIIQYIRNNFNEQIR